MKKLFLASVAALSVLSTSVAYTADESDPPLPRFRPWQQVWQCNDVRVTITGRDPFSVCRERQVRTGLHPQAQRVCESPVHFRCSGFAITDSRPRPERWQAQDVVGCL
jgi:hypothetical protein